MSNDQMTGHEVGDDATASLRIDLEHEIRNLSAPMKSAVDVIRLDAGLANVSLEMLGILDRQLILLTRLATELSGQSHKYVFENEAELAPSASIASTFADRELDILIVDDTRMASYTLQKMLEKMGHRVRSASNGDFAMDAVRERLPDVVFSDIAMAAMTGYQLAKKIRSLTNGSEIHLVALTGCCSNDAKRKSMEAGFDEHVVKPISHDILVKLLSRMQTNCKARDILAVRPLEVQGDSTNENENDKDQKYQPDSTAGIVAPITTMRPSWNTSQQHKNQQD